MKTPLTTLLTRNPFLALNLSVDDSDESVRHRIEELEVEAQFDGSSSIGRDDIVLARQLLEDPRQRIECEFFAPWTSSATYEPVAGPHDTALRTLRRTLDRLGSGGPSGSLTVLQRWSRLLEDASLEPIVQARLISAGVRISARDWLHDTIADTVLPEVVQRTLDQDRGMAIDLAEALDALPVEHVGPAAAVIAEAIVPDVDESRIRELEPRYLLRLIPLVGKALEPVRETAPRIYHERISTLVERCKRRSWAVRQTGQRREAMQILESLLQLELLESDRLTVQEELSQLRR